MYIYIYIYTHTLWLFNVAMENVPFIDDKHEDLPINSMVIFSMATLVITRGYIEHTNNIIIYKVVPPSYKLVYKPH